MSYPGIKWSQGGSGAVHCFSIVRPDDTLLACIPSMVQQTKHNVILFRRWLQHVASSNLVSSKTKQTPKNLLLMDLGLTM